MTARYKMAGAVLAPLLLAAMAFLGACGGGSGPQERELDLRIEDRKLDLEGGTIKVNQGDTVTLSISSNERGSVHLHGYDIEREVAPGAAATMSFVASATGRFNMTFHPGGEEEHEADEAEEVPLGALEVRPR